jgi:hypothetical protein
MKRSKHAAKCREVNETGYFLRLDARGKVAGQAKSKVFQSFKVQPPVSSKPKHSNQPTPRWKRPLLGSHCETTSSEDSGWQW